MRLNLLDPVYTWEDGSARGTACSEIGEDRPEMVYVFATINEKHMEASLLQLVLVKD